MRYVKLQTVLNYISLDENEFNDVDELLVQAMSEFNIAPLLEHTATNIEVINHKGELPDDLVQIRYVALNNGASFNVSDLCDDCTDNGDDTYNCQNCGAFTEATQYQYPISLNEAQACRIRQQGVTYIFDY